MPYTYEKVKKAIEDVTLKTEIKAPVGTIFLVDLDGLIPCDGRKLPIPDYPELFQTLRDNISYEIRKNWGTADWKYFFNVPDLVDAKGVFGYIKAK